jgi:DNA-binding CsgD family transcriptional regulator
MLRKDRLEQEFLAIRKIYPTNGADLKILIWLAAGLSYQETAERVERTHRTIKNAARRLRQFRDCGKGAPQ